MAKIFTIGEMLIDFIPDIKNCALKDVKSFSKMAGGAPANVAVCAAILGAESYFIGKFSEDSFGDFLIDSLKKYNVKTDYIFKTNKANTALAFVSLMENGERDFSFYRNPSADMLLEVEEVKDIRFNKGDIISFCSVDLVDYPVRYATKKVLENAKEDGAIVVFDPNLRLNLWDNHDELYKIIGEFSKFADIIKISEDELEFITRQKSFDDAILYLENLGISNIVITKGADGAFAKFNNIEIEAEGLKVNSVDATGAGDSFVGALLYKLSKLNKDLKNITKDDLDNIISFANKVAAIVTTKYGAMDSIPTMSEINDFNTK